MKFQVTLLFLISLLFIIPDKSLAAEVSCANVDVYYINLATGQNMPSVSVGIRCTTGLPQCSGTVYKHVDGICWENSGYQEIPASGPYTFEGYDCDKGGGQLYNIVPSGWSWVCTTDESRYDCEQGSNVDINNLGLTNGAHNVVKVFFNPPSVCTPSSCDAPEPECGKTTSGSDGCTSCTKTGPVCACSVSWSGSTTPPISTWFSAGVTKSSSNAGWVNPRYRVAGGGWQIATGTGPWSFDVYSGDTQSTHTMDFAVNEGALVCTPSQNFTATCPSSISAPTGLSPTGSLASSTTSVDLTWNSVTGATKYNVRIRNNNLDPSKVTCGGAVTCFDNLTGTSQNNVSVTAGNSYHWWVDAVKTTTGCSDISSSTGADFSVAAISVLPPTVRTDPATSVLSTTATLNGNVTNGGSTTVSGRGFYRKLASNTFNCVSTDTSGCTVVTSGSGTGIFSSGQTGLTAGTAYRYKAYANNSVGFGYGEWEDFTTTAAPSVTLVATSPIVSGDSTTLTWTITGTATSCAVSNSGTPTITSGNWSSTLTSNDGGVNNVSAGTHTRAITMTTTTTGATKTFNITCTNSGLDSAPASTSVTVNIAGSACPTTTAGYSCAASPPVTGCSDQSSSYTCSTGKCYFCPPPPTPTLTLSCINTPNLGSEATITWTNNAVPVTYVDLSSDNFATYYHKAVSTTANSTASTSGPAGFYKNPSSPAELLVIVGGNSYKARLYNGISNNVVSGSAVSATSCSAAFDFTLTNPNPSTVTVTQGGSAGTTSVTTNKSGSPLEAVTLTIDPTGTQIPSGASVIFSNNPCPSTSSTCTSIISITPGTAATGTYNNIRIKGTATGGITKTTAAFTLVINSPAAGTSAPWIQTINGDVHSNTGIIVGN